VWRGGDRGEAELLASCYRRSLELAVAHQLASIAFPMISTGAYGYPMDEAAAVAVATVRAFLAANGAPARVLLCAFDAEATAAIAAAL
jgi:O-acetyl-ADP-ribose deacetylase (regulator of RNase III)